MNTRTALKLMASKAEFYLVCSRNPKHRWVHSQGVFSFDGSWERRPVTGSMFDTYLDNMPMPKVRSLGDYSRVQLGIKKKSGYAPHCPLCKMDCFDDSSALVFEYPQGGR